MVTYVLAEITNWETSRGHFLQLNDSSCYIIGVSCSDLAQDLGDCGENLTAYEGHGQLIDASKYDVADREITRHIEVEVTVVYIYHRQL